MKSRFIFFVFSITVALSLISWGVTGHRSIAKIAENHLSVKAKLAVKAILGKEDMAMASTFADEIRATPKYRKTSNWHYINPPENLSYGQFVKYLKSDSTPNVYNALLKMVEQLKNVKTNKEEKRFALKMLIHLVGDLHQPMHVSRTKDQGGNKIQLRFNNKGTNLHALWDSGLINYSGLTFTEMATALDNVSNDHIREWQRDELSKWLFESYQISAQLYQEVEGKTSLDYTYYPSHSKLYQERIQKAGIRLAGLLNQIYK